MKPRRKAPKPIRSRLTNTPTTPKRSPHHHKSITKHPLRTSKRSQSTTQHNIVCSNISRFPTIILSRPLKLSKLRSKDRQSTTLNFSPRHFSGSSSGASMATMPQPPPTNQPSREQLPPRRVIEGEFVFEPALAPQINAILTASQLPTIQNIEGAIIPQIPSPHLDPTRVKAAKALITVAKRQSNQLLTLPMIDTISGLIGIPPPDLISLAARVVNNMDSLDIIDSDSTMSTAPITPPFDSNSHHVTLSDIKSVLQRPSGDTNPLLNGGRIIHPSIDLDGIFKPEHSVFSPEELRNVERALRSSPPKLDPKSSDGWTGNGMNENVYPKGRHVDPSSIISASSSIQHKQQQQQQQHTTHHTENQTVPSAETLNTQSPTLHSHHPAQITATVFDKDHQVDPSSTHLNYGSTMFGSYDSKGQLHSTDHNTEVPRKGSHKFNLSEGNGKRQKATVGYDSERGLDGHGPHGVNEVHEVEEDTYQYTTDIMGGLVDFDDGLAHRHDTHKNHFRDSDPPTDSTTMMKNSSNNNILNSGQPGEGSDLLNALARFGDGLSQSSQKVDKTKKPPKGRPGDDFDVLNPKETLSFDATTHQTKKAKGRPGDNSSDDEDNGGTDAHGDDGLDQEQSTKQADINDDSLTHFDDNDDRLLPSTQKDEKRKKIKIRPGDDYDVMLGRMIGGGNDDKSMLDDIQTTTLGPNGHNEAPASINTDAKQQQQQQQHSEQQQSDQTEQQHFKDRHTLEHYQQRLGLDQEDTMQTDPNKIIEPVAWQRIHKNNEPEPQYQSQPQEQLVPHSVKIKVRLALKEPPVETGVDGGNGAAH